MRTLFISDLHLHPSRPKTMELFLAFMATKAKESDALYLLGDFFEYWIGDDFILPEYQPILAALRAYSTLGKKLYWIHGNRDFLVGPKLLRSIGAQFLDDPFIASFNGQPWVLSHGDLLCTQDCGYQWYRRFVRTSLIQTIFLALPLSWRLTITKKIRQSSANKYKKRKPVDLRKYDVAQHSVETLLTKSQASVLLHGHTHQHRVIEFTLHNNSVTRIVMGDWSDAAGSYLEVTETGVSLNPFKAC